MLIHIVGGDASLSFTTTLPNILRRYNPNLYGFSFSYTPFMNFVNLTNTQFNLAATGGLTGDVLSQAQELVRKMRADSRVDFDNDWKMVTVLVGYNDLCMFSCESGRGRPNVYRQDLINAFDYMQENMPRTFVNLIQLTHMRELQEQILMNTARSVICRAAFNAGCACSPYGTLNVTADTFDQLIEDYQQALRSIVSSGRYNNSDSFTVVLQPFQTRIELNQTTFDLSSFIDDCTHFSPIGMRDLATGLWQNLFEAVGAKSTNLSIPTQGLTCPTDGQEFFLTARSGVVVNPATTGSGE